MFCVCPEMQLSQVFISVLTRSEAVQMIGFTAFSEYTGYSGTLKFAGAPKPIHTPEVGCYIIIIFNMSIGTNWKKSFYVGNICSSKLF